MREMIQTERDYVKSLEYIIEVSVHSMCVEREELVGFIFAVRDLCRACADR